MGIPFSCSVIFTPFLRYKAIIASLVTESDKILRVLYFTLPFLVNIFTFISAIIVPYNTGVYWVVFCFLGFISFQKKLKRSLGYLVLVQEWLPTASLIF